jgi:hypothetical protein
MISQHLFDCVHHTVTQQGSASDASSSSDSSRESGDDLYIIDPAMRQLQRDLDAADLEDDASDKVCYAEHYTVSHCWKHSLINYCVHSLVQML